MDGIAGKLQIGLFDGKYWDTWKYKAMCLLRTVPSALEIVQGSFQQSNRPPTRCGDAELQTYEQEKNKYDKADANANLILTTNMEEEILRKVMQFNKAHDVWLELYRLFDGTSEDKSYNLCMSSSAKDQADDIATHMSKLKNIWTELNQELKKDSNQELPELLLICKILDTLDDSYFSFRSSWLLLPESNRTVENLTSHLCAFERPLQGTTHPRIKQKPWLQTQEKRRIRNLNVMSSRGNKIILNTAVNI